MNKLVSNKKYIFLFVGPAFAFYVMFGLIPVIYNLYLSMFNTNLMLKHDFVGLGNFIKLFQDQFFLKALGNNLKFVVGCYIAHMCLALLLSNILLQKMKFAMLFQSIYFMPSVICGAAIGLLWRFIYHPEFGLLNSFFVLIGKDEWTRNWLAETETVMIALIVVTMWQFVGYHMVIQLAAMRNIDIEIYQAADIDGANGIQKFTLITLPLIKPVLAIDSIIIITGSLKLYDLIAVTTAGGPNHASEVLSTYMFYTGFKQLKFGYSSAMATIMLILCLLAYVIVNKLLGTDKEKNA